MKAHIESTFEASIVEYLTGHGWVQGNPGEYSRPLGLCPAELVRFVEVTQPKEWAKLSGLHGPQVVEKFAKRVASEITARGTVDVLRRGVKDLGVTVKLAFFAPAHDLTPELRELFDANRLTVARQVHHSESSPGGAVDLMLFVNGLPVATAELKTQTAGQSMADAVKQYRYDRDPKDLVFAHRTVVHFAVDQDTVAMTTRLAGRETVFLPFNQGSSGPGVDGGKGNPTNPAGARTAYLWEVVWSLPVWLGLFGSFVHVEVDKKAKTSRTVFPRYHQWDAVTKLLEATRREGPGSNKLIQHSAGSGKSNSIAWLAHGLASLHTSSDLGFVPAGMQPNTPVFDKVVIVTDRVVLDRQLQATVAGFEHQPGLIESIGKDKTSADLRAALESKRAKIIVTTLQKFPVVAQTAIELAGTRFAVIADEAHSSQTGEAGKDLKAVLSGTTGDEALAAAEQADRGTEAAGQDLEDALVASAETRGRQDNLTFFAFTATPKAKTLEMFGHKVTDAAGQERFVPFHLYSMRQAIEEGFILDVLANYTTYTTYYRLANRLSADDPVLPKGRAASALARYVSLHPTNLAQKAEIIVEHFRAHTQTRIGGKAKAMVVTRSRLHAVKYWQAITKYVAAKGYGLGVLVAFSGEVFDPDTPNVPPWREAGMNGFGEAALPKRFATDEFQVLIVAEKYQTGFDQPLLHTMYVDKRLDGIKAVQTLSRLNRTHPGKEDTFVLDFANDVEDIREAFRPYYAETAAAPTDPNVLYTLERRIKDAGVLDDSEVGRGVRAILAGGTKGSAELNAAITPAKLRWEALDEDDQELFRTALRDFTRAYAFISQIAQFTDAGLEKLYYYGKYLLNELDTQRDPATVDLDGSVVLTHLRMEMTADQVDGSLHRGSDEPLRGIQDGEGKKHSVPEERLSELINTLNERFGMNLTDADKILFDQQVQSMVEDEEVQDAAKGNDFDQFSVFAKKRLTMNLLKRHSANEDLVKAFLDVPEFKEMVEAAVLAEVYEKAGCDVTAQELKDFAPYVTAVVALVVFFVTRQSESRKRNADVLGDFIATAQEVAHSIAEVWRTAPRTKAFDIDDATWKRTVGEVDAKLTQLLRKVQIVGSNKTVAAAENVRNSVNAMRDAIEFSLETDSGTNVYVGTPASSKLGSRWAKANAASLKRVHGCEPADVESLPLAWERPSAGHVSDSELDAQSAEGGSASDAEVKAAFTSGWLVVWGIWRHDRDEFIHLARRQVGPRPRWVWLAVGLAVVLGLAGLFWVVA